MKPANHHATTHARSYSAHSSVQIPSRAVPLPPSEHGAIGCGIVALVIGLLLLRAIPWLGAVFSFVGGILILQWIASYGAAGWLAAGVVVVGSIVGALVLAVKFGSAEARRLALLEKAPLTPIHPSGIVALPGETFYWQGIAKWLEFHTERQYSGGYGGVSVRVTRGVSLRSGSTTGRSRPVTVANTTRGTVYLSDRRILFISPVFSRDIHLKSALHFAKGPGFIRVDMPNATSFQIETANSALGIALDKVLAGRTQTRAGDSPPLAPGSPAPAPGDAATKVVTKKWAVDQLVARLDKTFPALQQEFDTARTSPRAPVGAVMTQQQSGAWVREKLARLSALGRTLATLATADLETVLSTTADANQASAAQEKWVHEVSTFCYELIDWELDVKTAHLDPLFAHAQTLMRGLTEALFSPVMQIETQLKAVDASTITGPVRVVTAPSSNAIAPLQTELQRIGGLMTKPGG